MKYVFAILLSAILFNQTSAQKYVYVFLNTNHEREQLPKEQADSLQKGHMDHIQKLAKEDKLIVAGPFNSGGGIFIMNTTSTTEAREWISSDPAIAANRYRIETLPWTPRVGGACLVDTTAEFATYTFVRYNTLITKFNVQDAPRLFKQHDDYLNKIEASGNVISEGYFDNSDGGVLVMKGDVEPAVIMNDPTVKNGIIQPVIKQIWVSKGSFCEE